jgi:hypothetical protein
MENTEERHPNDADAPHDRLMEDDSDSPYREHDGKDDLVREPERGHPPERPNADLAAPDPVSLLKGDDVTVPRRLNHLAGSLGYGHQWTLAIAHLTASMRRTSRGRSTGSAHPSVAESRSKAHERRSIASVISCRHRDQHLAHFCNERSSCGHVDRRV